jgi:hypothetical protein
VTVSTLPPPVVLELPFSHEESLVLMRGAWVDIRHDSGWWYASLRIEPFNEAEGVNGFCDAWNGPHFSRESAISNGYAHGRHQALAAHVPAALKLHRSAWSYLS